MTKLVTAILARNEAAEDRYLRRVIERCRTFSDAVLLLDDRSTDHTAKIAKLCGATVKGRSILADPAWGAEAPARAELWKWAAEEADDGWVLVCDADMLLEGDPRPLCESWAVNTWSWALYDCWDGEDRARVDGAWAYGPVTARPWLFCPSRVPEGWTPQWHARQIHAGHAPTNWPIETGVTLDIWWRHLSYLQPQHRVTKHHQYMEVAAHMTPFERQHVESIIA